jgi:hypothetical protein
LYTAKLKLLINKQKIRSKLFVFIQQELNGGEGELLEIENLVSKYSSLKWSPDMGTIKRESRKPRQV